MIADFVKQNTKYFIDFEFVKSFQKIYN